VEKRWISVKTCAGILGLHVKSVYSLIARGEIPAGKIGRSVRIDLQALEKKLEGRSIK
jgi:excisionase family DNA binding protein